MIVELSHRIADGPEPAHVPVARLADPPGERFRFHAVPPMVAGTGIFPVPAYAALP
ncbi:MAG TPA: hypothetical protein VFV66_37275 [Nonomuraea sp.]|nr:hypothetical protein [Nonomuraea sp.]